MKYIIQNDKPLKGIVKVSGSKNAVLPVMAASILTDGAVTIRDVPCLSDVQTMESMLQALGVKVRYDNKAGVINLSVPERLEHEAPYELVCKMRASFLVMGPLLARLGKVNVPLPGGCAIGSRPVDLHLKGFTALGAEIVQEHGFVSAQTKKLRGAKIYLDFPSVGATENIMMAATLAEGMTVIENCAVEPEIVDLANFLNSAGAQIRGAGTGTIRVTGVKRLNGTDHTVIPDRIEAGTFMIAAGITRGDITVTNVVADHLKSLIAKLKEVNLLVDEDGDGIRVIGEGRKLRATDVKTLPYPGFPTDMQAQFMCLLTKAEGASIVTETLYENRFMHVGELKRMGADIKIESRSAVIEGVPELTGAQVKATDLRAGAALVLAGLSASGSTEISDIYHIERGYCELDTKLNSLGAHIIRVGQGEELIK
ncbi:MAG: UDP-N-acetylglucosamine 1-carboxyvinyltransferase [Clostridiales bacterium]|nr:UDP-N-acetylglucosamine 1-carboxyvinyltransferase [Clostridiales bacterium]